VLGVEHTVIEGVSRGRWLATSDTDDNALRWPIVRADTPPLSTVVSSE
jgi:hypothetical protein